MSVISATKNSGVTKVAFIYYISIIWGLLDPLLPPPSPNISIFYGLIISNYCHILTPLSKVLERIWIKGSYISQWLPQGERWPLKESKLRWIEIFHGGSQQQIFLQSFFQKTFFFSGTKKKFQGTTFVQFFMYCKAKKNFGVIRKFLKIFDFQKSLSKLRPTVEDFNSSWFWLLRGSPFTLW